MCSWIQQLLFLQDIFQFLFSLLFDIMLDRGMLEQDFYSMSINQSCSCTLSGEEWWQYAEYNHKYTLSQKTITFLFFE